MHLKLCWNSHAQWATRQCSRQQSARVALGTKPSRTCTSSWSRRSRQRHRFADEHLCIWKWSKLTTERQICKTKMFFFAVCFLFNSLRSYSSHRSRWPFGHSSFGRTTIFHIFAFSFLRFDQHLHTHYTHCIRVGYIARQHCSRQNRSIDNFGVRRSKSARAHANPSIFL